MDKINSATKTAYGMILKKIIFFTLSLVDFQIWKPWFIWQTNIVGNSKMPFVRIKNDAKAENPRIILAEIDLKELWLETMNLSISNIDRVEKNRNEMSEIILLLNSRRYGLNANREMKIIDSRNERRDDTNKNAQIRKSMKKKILTSFKTKGFNPKK